jgi:hypothetical protein
MKSGWQLIFINLFATMITRRIRGSDIYISQAPDNRVTIMNKHFSIIATANFKQLYQISQFPEATQDQKQSCYKKIILLRGKP